ncbi:MAG: tRNA preQ1(34) S-adenosylmethionine ribosyltransferase-isomerase QueA [Synergistaceae bacterium]|nr:tRNA preQ1(34) S-adenosylmethionine ribosyltransferase-isomerase QueA [Synergistaceae bacterium]
MKKLIAHEDLYDLSSYDYNLPPENIAQSPANPRDSSKLLVWKVKSDEVFTDKKFRDITEFFRPGDLLILNDTRVIPARLKGIRQSGGSCEIFLLRNLTPDFLIWEALVKPARKIHTGSIINVNDKNLRILDEGSEGIRTVKFELSSREEFMNFLDEAGKVPLPPYIHNDNDMREAYQTVFARNDGSVAAPTASLHFTPELLAEMKSMGVKIAYVTLHVGLGTFRPVKTQDIRQHEIHTEHCELSEDTARLIRECKAEGGRVIASGTTAARTLESFNNEWGIKDTGLFIYPGYKFRVVDALITNFHLPESSLIMLVASFASNLAGAWGHEEKILSRLLEIYETCAKNNWRFFSFGDAMFLE